MSATAREKMVVSAAMLLREYGLTATSVRDVVEHSGAPRGSIYHHFPDGKVQIVEEAVGFAGDAITRGIAEIAKTNDPVGSLKTFIELWRQVLIRSDFRAGCPVVAVAAEAQESSEEDARLARATSSVFTDWTAALATGLRDEGIPAKRAQTLATLLIASVEGAVVMSRSQRDTAPLDDVGKELESLIAAALNPAV